MTLKGNASPLAFAGEGARTQNLRCLTDLPLRRIRRRASMPTWIWLSTYSALTFASEASVLTPSGVIGWSANSSSAPQGMRVAKPAAKVVAVALAMATHGTAPGGGRVCKGG